MVNIFNSTKYSAVLPQLQDHKKKYRRRKKRKREMNEHSPIPPIQESAADVTISKEKATGLTPVVDNELTMKSYGRFYLTQMNRTQQGRELQFSPADGHPRHNTPATVCGQCRSLRSVGSTANLRTLSRRQVTYHFLSLVWPYNWPLKARCQRSDVL